MVIHWRLDVTSPTKNDGTVIINKNGTVTFLPATDFTGIDSFIYTTSDGKDCKKDGGIWFDLMQMSCCPDIFIWELEWVSTWPTVPTSQLIAR